jgi:hypothetical protein
MKWTPDQIDSVIKLIIGSTFCVVLLMMSSLAMYSVVFVTQPMVGIAPADKQFFMLLSDMSKYILGALATLLAIKGKDGVAKLIDPPPGVSKASDWTDPQPPAPKAPAPVHAPVRVEPQLDPTPAAPVVTGFGGKAAPPPAPQPEID